MWREVALRLDQRDIRSTASKLPERKRTRACFDDAWRVIWLKAGSDVMGLIIAGGCDSWGGVDLLLTVRTGCVYDHLSCLCVLARQSASVHEVPISGNLPVISFQECAKRQYHLHSSEDWGDFGRKWLCHVSLVSQPCGGLVK